MNDTINTLKNHRTYRHFKSGQPLPAEHLQAIIDCARQASSWMNGQHFSIINITDPDLRAKICALQPNNPQLATCSTLLNFVADLHRAKLASEAYQGAFSAAGDPDSLISAVTDTALAAENTAIAAESLGYGICFVGGIRLIAPHIVELLALPKHTFPLFGLCIGIPDTEMQLKPKLPENAIYSENRYPAAATQIQALADYESTMTAFAEAREKLPFREKFARYYSNTYAPDNLPLLHQQGFLTLKF